MATKRKQYTAAFKAQVALAALNGDKTINELASPFGVHPTLIQDWKKHLLSTAEQLFAHGKKADNTAQTAAQKAELFEQIGRLKMALEWLKKKLHLCAEQRRRLIDVDHPHLSVRRQCQLLGLKRSSFYYELASETEENLRRRRLIDQEYTAHPFLGSRRLTTWLNQQGEAVNRKRVQRLMRRMGLEAIYPKPKLSATGRGHRMYPYLLRNVSIDRADQVWSTDITSVPLANGFRYLAAIIDWFSRYVLAWRLSNTLDGSFCLEMLEEALSRGQPEVFNTGQGVQFTASAWTSRLESAGVAVSMAGRGRCLDNVFVERLWRAVKYEEVYLHRYERVPQLASGLRRYFVYYNEERLHQSLDYRTPASIYRSGRRSVG